MRETKVGRISIVAYLHLPSIYSLLHHETKWLLILFQPTDNNTLIICFKMKDKSAFTENLRKEETQIKISY